MTDLFLGFLRVGCFSFGGAYAAIPLIRDVVLSRGWITEDMLTAMIAVGESTPGPIMVNLATYIGRYCGGLWGAVIATFAVVLPAFLIILLVMVLLQNILKNPYTQAILRGLKSCMVGIILATGVSMTARHAVTDARSVLLTALLLSITFGTRLIQKKRLSPFVLIALSALLGIVVFGI